jgi:hypothetical protein
METTQKIERSKMSLKRRLFLMAVGYLALALDKLEGKSIEPPKVKRGRIKIVD